MFVSLRMGKYANGIGTGLERDGKELVRHQRGIESKDNIVGSLQLLTQIIVKQTINI